MSARPGPSGGYHASGIPTGISEEGLAAGFWACHGQHGRLGLTVRYPCTRCFPSLKPVSARPYKADREMLVEQIK